MSGNTYDRSEQIIGGLLAIILMMAVVGWVGYRELTMQRDFWQMQYCAETTLTLSFCDKTINDIVNQ